FYFGNKMDASRGNPYSYARDVNVTIGSDGTDLRKGYTFSFGGQDNTCSYIMRDGVIVKRLPVTIPRSMDYHRHWFQVKAERHGNSVPFRVAHLVVSQHRLTADMVHQRTVPRTGDRVA